jgi:hypothetical protein
MQADGIASIEHIDIHNPVIVQISANVLNLIYMNNNPSECPPPPCYPCLPPCSGWESCWECPDAGTAVPSSAPYDLTDSTSGGDRDNDLAALADAMQEGIEEMHYLEHAPANWNNWKACRATLWSMYLIMRSELTKLRAKLGTKLAGFCR